MKIRELMVKNVATIALDKNVSAQEAARVMNEKMIGCLLAVSGDAVVGILTERDLLERIVETCRNPKETKVSEIMSKDIIVGNPDMELVEATRLMFKNKIKKLPIVEKDQLVGIITLTDVARATAVDEQTINLIQALTNMHKIGESQWFVNIAQEPKPHV
jgi:CBS domain-containing protein